ncbi:hypothetical protein VKT23_004608 [Stygiomarasmius scandens]|uniref:Uncharacterized protein n=1 Tax=Marasmiellus scandens TaxID=2682957 RepID=A0ABR1JXR5_9AGAR
MARSPSKSPSKSPQKLRNKQKKARTKVSGPATTRSPATSNSTPSNSAKKTLRGRRTVKDKEDDDTITPGSAASGPRISWDKDLTRTDRLLDKLENDVSLRNKLFSDSSENAKSEGRRKQVSKTGKLDLHRVLAKAVFENDAKEDVREDYKANPDKYAKSVENYLGRLKREYRDTNNRIGKTGAGLDYSQVEEGSALQNLIQQEIANFPAWERLHGFWRKLPNYNPFPVSSEPGQQLAEAASDVLLRVSSEKQVQPEGSGNSSSDESDVPASPTAGKGVQNVEKAAPSKLGSKKSKGTKRTLTETFTETTESDSKVLEALARQRHERSQVGQQLKREKLQLQHKQEMARIEADERARKERYDRERERERHELEMMRLRMGLGGSQMLPYAGNYHTGFGFGNLDTSDSFNNSGGNSTEYQADLPEFNNGF